MDKKIFIGCDNAGIALKPTVLSVLAELHCDVEDVGVLSTDDGTYYPLVAERLCRQLLAADEPAQGILLCGTGIGMAMTANKFPGIYAAVCHDIYSAERSRLSNDGNVLCMGARVIGPELARVITRRWLELTFRDGSSTPKIAAMRRIDREHRV